MFDEMKFVKLISLYFFRSRASSQRPRRSTRLALSRLVQGIIMFFVKRSLEHVRKLHIDDLSAKKMSARTQQCGSIARKCPCWCTAQPRLSFSFRIEIRSRWLFFFMSVGLIMGRVFH